MRDRSHLIHDLAQKIYLEMAPALNQTFFFFFFFFFQNGQNFVLFGPYDFVQVSPACGTYT